MKNKWKRIMHNLLSRQPIHSFIGDVVSLNLKTNSLRKRVNELSAIVSAMDPSSAGVTEAKVLLRSMTFELDDDGGVDREKYDTLDPLILPLCTLLCERGFHTFASCSGHVGTYRHKGASAFLKKHWYILFVPGSSLSPVRQAVRTLQEEHGIPIELTRFSKDSHDPLILYRLQVDLQELHPSYTDQDLERWNRLIYTVFRETLDD